MLFYIFFTLLIFVFFFRYKWNGEVRPHSFFYIGCALFIAVVIFRYDVGYDYWAYYLSIKPFRLSHSIERMELFNQWIYALVNYVGYPPLLFFIYGAGICSLFFITVKRYSHFIGLSVLLFLYLFNASIFSTIRQGLADVIVLYSIGYIMKKDWLKYYLCCAIAFLFHSSSIVAIFFPFILKFINSPIKILLVVVVLISAFTVLINYFINEAGLYEHYMSRTEEFSGGNLTRYVTIIILLTSYVLAWIKSGVKSLNCRFIGLALIGMVFPFVLGGHLGGRMSEYFLVFTLIAIPNVVVKYSMFIRGSYSFLTSILFILIIYTSTKNPSKPPMTPYQTIFTQDVYHPKFKPIHLKKK